MIKVFFLLNFIFFSVSISGQDLLFWGSAVPNEFYSLDLTTNSVNIIATGQSRITRIRVDQNLKQVFWSSQFLNKIQKADANLSGTNISDVKTNITQVATIATDAINNKIYYHLNGGSEIFSCDTLGGSTTTVVNFGSVTSILGLQVVGDELYWSQQSSSSNSISKINLTSSNISSIYSTNELLFDIVILPEDSSIYFTNRTGNRIQKIKLDGSNLQTIITETGLIGTLSGDYCNNVLYYVVNRPVSGTNGSQIKKTDLIGSTPVILIDTSFSFLAGVDALYEFNIGKRKDFLGPDIFTCEDSVELNSTVYGASYLWSTNDTTSVISVKQSGNYKVTITLKNCSKIDSINVTFSSNFSVDIGKDTILCFEDSLLLDATTPGATYLWQDSSVNSTFNVTSTGIYWVQVELNGCFKRDSINVIKNPEIIVDLGEDTSLCFQETLLLDATNPGATYLWQDSSVNSTFNVSSSGFYWVDVTLGGCKKRDSIRVTFVPDFTVNIGSDTTLCFGDSVILDANTPMASYLWSDSSTNAILKVRQAGIYWVDVSFNGCMKRDSILIEYFDTVNGSFLPNFSRICDDEILFISLPLQNSFYIWQNGSTERNITINESGLYTVKIVNSCGTRIDTAVVTKGCDCKVIPPTIFTPNYDYINDLFTIRINCKLEFYNISIYNRWGGKVFESKQQNNSWDGSYNGKNVKSGTYFYIINYKASNEKEKSISGSFLLTR
tara:strand:- start:7596 stop:9767 length:2172 start_codon:yes stop_codon:yes gene_type:complete